MDKTSSRRYKIIDLLSKEDRWFKSREFAVKLNCTEKTIRNDIQYINSILPSDWYIKSVKGKGIYIYKPPNSTFNEIRTLFIQNSITLKAIMLILYKEVKFNSDLSKALYTQHNAVYSIMNKVEELVRSYHLTVRRTPINIEGNEYKKRVLGCDILYGLYSHSNNWPFKYSKTDIQTIVLKVTENNQLYLYPKTSYKYVYYLGILLNAIDKKIPMKLHTAPFKKIKKSAQYFISNKICDELEKVFEKYIPFEERIAFTLFISTLPSYRNDKIDESEILHLYENQCDLFYEELYDLVDMLKTELAFDFHLNSEFIISLQKHFKTILIHLELTEVVNPTSPIVNYVKKQYSNLFNQTKLVLHNWTTKHAYPQLGDHFIANITLIIQSTIRSKNSRKKRVLLLTSEGFIVNRYTAIRLKEAFGDKLKFVEHKIETTKLDHLYQQNIDLIISDYEVYAEGIPVIYIDSILTNRDLNQISRMIN